MHKHLKKNHIAIFSLLKCTNVYWSMLLGAYLMHNVLLTIEYPSETLDTQRGRAHSNKSFRKLIMDNCI